MGEAKHHRRLEVIMCISFRYVFDIDCRVLVSHWLHVPTLVLLLVFLGLSARRCETQKSLPWDIFDRVWIKKSICVGIEYSRRRARCLPGQTAFLNLPSIHWNSSLALHLAFCFQKG